MDIDVFVKQFADQFNQTSVNEFYPGTVFWELDEWSSLIALSVISMIDEEYGVILRSIDIKGVKTIQELFEVVKAKMQ